MVLDEQRYDNIFFFFKKKRNKTKKISANNRRHLFLYPHVWHIMEIAL